MSVETLRHCAKGSHGLNTLTVGQPLVGRGSRRRSEQQRLNTLTVGQPLVGWLCHKGGVRPLVSIPSQSGSLLSVEFTVEYDESGTCLNTLTVGQPLVGFSPWHRAKRRLESQYPHSRAASCRTKTPSPTMTPYTRSQYPHSRAASCRPPQLQQNESLWMSQYPHSRAASCRSDRRVRPGLDDRVSIPSQSGSLLSVSR